MSEAVDIASFRVTDFTKSLCYANMCYVNKVSITVASYYVSVFSQFILHKINKSLSTITLVILICEHHIIVINVYQKHL